MKKIFYIIFSFIRVRYFNKWKNREQLLKFQDRQVAKQLKFFKNNSPYFKNHNVDENFKMNKDFMMKNFDELNTLGVKKNEALQIALNSEKNRDFSQKYKNISVGLSSGTSGHRGLFITTPAEKVIW